MSDPSNISFVFQGETYTSARALCQAFRQKWPEAQDEVRSGRLRAWAASTGQDALQEALLKIEHTSDLSEDQKLFLSLAQIDPDQPLCWKQVCLAPAEIEKSARLALGGAPDSEKAQTALLEALRDNVITLSLRVFLPHKSQAALDAFIKLQNDFLHHINLYSTIFHLYEKKVTRHNVYYNHDAAALDVLLFLLSSEHVSEMKEQAKSIATKEALSCPWYKHLNQTAEKEPVLLLFVLMLSSVAQAEARLDTEWAELAKAREGTQENPLAPVMVPIRTEGPSLRESLFLIGKYPITVGEYTKYTGMIGHSAGEGWTYPGFLQDEKHPVVNITWEEAVAYAEWLSKLTGHPYTLPTEKQWIAAAGPSLDQRENPDDYGTFHRAGGQPVHGTTPVDAHPANHQGVSDISGNTWDWLMDHGHAEGTHLLRGGAWDQTIDQHHLHHHSESATENNTIGFRVVRLYGVYPPEEQDTRLFYLPSVLKTLNVGALEQGSPNDFFSLAEMYRDGHNVPQDRDESIKWFRKAAEAGHLPSQLHLAQLYSEGRFVSKNEAEAAKWFLMAAKQGHRDAQMSYALMLEEGHAFKTNPEEAAKWFMAAAEQGNPEAQHRLACMMRDGRGVEKNQQMAATWFQKAAENGHPVAQYDLACALRDGIGFPKSESDALTWFSTSALQGNLRAQVALAELYRDGRGIEQNEKEAFHWFMQAANRGDIEAQYHAAIMLAGGRGTVRNETDALKWFQISGQQGYLAAQLQSAFMHKEGRGCQRDWPEAMRWFQMAAEQNDPEACFELAEIYWLAPDEMPRREAEALSLFMMAEKAGHPGAHERISEILGARKHRRHIRIAIFTILGLFILGGLIATYMSIIAGRFTVLVQQRGYEGGEERVLVIKRIPGLSFLESADSICLHETSGAGPECRQFVTDQLIPRATIIAEFGYSDFIYGLSMDGRTYMSSGDRQDRSEFTSSPPLFVRMNEPYVYNIATSGSGFRNILVLQKPSWLNITRSDVRHGTLTLEGMPMEEDNATPGTYKIHLRLDDNSLSLLYQDQVFNINVIKNPDK
ncbi:MAG TPA: hypothetical protein DCW68_05070 [Rhodospirillaceae bacterium]|nr:MAG: hypothetical protein A2018_02575 [Alphaproteobacteria bacterium GWF2_58_20]HAU29467.1 hypothetical protein [Rhodospirillaceae bacterium]